MLCDNLQGWDGGGGKREGTYVYSWLIHGVVWQKLIQHCKAIIQLKINFKSHSKFCKNILQYNNLKKYVCVCAHMVMYTRSPYRGLLAFNNKNVTTVIGHTSNHLQFGIAQMGSILCNLFVHFSVCICLSFNSSGVQKGNQRRPPMAHKAMSNQA